ncbi:TPA: restriction endonuclease subunit S, partial [Streptococcus agalactiae]|nr:restriction endonuclease subunit S [Streptococcus agalactiae]
MPYDIPASWEWVRLRNISSLSFFPNISGDKIPNYSWVLDMEDIEKETGRLVRKNYKTEKSSYKSNKVYFSKDTVLYAKLRPNLKKVIISDEDGFATTELIPIKIFGGISAEYMRYCMISPSYYFNIIKSVYGVKMPRVNATFLNSTLLPLPPLSEQKRIVEQIERALEKVDAYSESYNKLQELDKSFPDKLKKSILQYAMQGKLVPQDPNDEPVEVLLEKIQAEKQKLYEEGKLKKKDLAEIVVTKGDDNSPYGKIPKNWSFLTIKDIFSITTGLSYKKTDLAITKNGVRIIRGGNINPLSFKILDNDYYIDPKFITSETVYLKRNQLLTPVSTSLEHIGKFARIDKDYPNTAAGGFVFQLTPFVSSDVLSKYLLFSLSSPIFYEQLKSITKLSGQALYNIPKTKLN